MLRITSLEGLIKVYKIICVYICVSLYTGILKGNDVMGSEDLTLSPVLWIKCSCLL